MEFNEKLQSLRKQKGLTQEELAAALYVSRTAISKWESGRGYPSIDSLKLIAAFFAVTVDALLSGEELLTVAEENVRESESHLCDLVFGLLDISIIMLFFLPLFGQKAGGIVQSVTLLPMTGIPLYLRFSYLGLGIGITVWGILMLSLQNCRRIFWTRIKYKVSLTGNAIGVLLFIISTTPYAAAILFFFLIIKAVLLHKKR